MCNIDERLRASLGLSLDASHRAAWKAYAAPALCSYLVATLNRSKLDRDGGLRSDIGASLPRKP